MVGRNSSGKIVQRPLSPHLQAYDMWQMSSAISIMHRITGSAWSAGTLLLVWWLVAAATGEDAFATVQWFMSSFLGLLILFGLTVAAWFHTLAGIRHLGWDAGYGYQIPTFYRTGRIVLIGTAAMTVLTWVFVLMFWG
ncbi:MAG: succinate dehydrogenase, cytochrome b556 subunit [Rubritepida sp.]|nr:succinate dehydrogenase, cytochrome b556 subunit [Rubritepida sp.]